MKELITAISLLVSTCAVGQSAEQRNVILTPEESRLFKEDKYGCRGDRHAFYYNLGDYQNVQEKLNLMKGMTRVEILNLFGESDKQEDSCIWYFLNYGNNQCRIHVDAEEVDDNILKICFEGDYVASAEVI